MASCALGSSGSFDFLAPGVSAGLAASACSGFEASGVVAVATVRETLVFTADGDFRFAVAVEDLAIESRAELFIPVVAVFAFTPEPPAFVFAEPGALVFAADDDPAVIAAKAWRSTFAREPEALSFVSGLDALVFVPEPGAFVLPLDACFDGADI